MKKNKLNSKSMLFNGVAMILSVLMMIFYACPHYVGSSLGSSYSWPRNGFETIKYMFNVNDKVSATMAGVMILILFIVAVLIFLLSTANMFSAMGVIKNMKVLKAINMILSVILAIAGIVAVVCVAVVCKDFSEIGIEYSNGWANITNLVLSVLCCISVSLDYYVAKK